MSDNSVKVRCGANEQDLEIAGKTVAEVRESLTETMNIPEDAQALISGDGVENGYELQAGDVLEFVKASGRKG